MFTPPPPVQRVWAGAIPVEAKQARTIAANRLCGFIGIDVGFEVKQRPVLNACSSVKRL